MANIKRNCDNCQTEYIAKESDVKRGWGLCCTKSCAATKREMSKPNYDPVKVIANNIKRENGDFNVRTTEGYKIVHGVAIDEWGEPVYNID